MSGSTIDMHNTPSLTGCFCVHSAAVLAVLLLVVILVAVLIGVLVLTTVLGFVLIIHGTSSKIVFVRLSRKDRMPGFLGFILGLKYNAGYQSGKNGGGDSTCGCFKAASKNTKKTVGLY